MRCNIDFTLRSIRVEFINKKKVHYYYFVNNGCYINEFGNFKSNGSVLLVNMY